MYLGSNDSAVAARLAVPPTFYLLQTLDPPSLLLRVLARSLVLWDSLRPDAAWFASLVPPFLRDAIAAASDQPAPPSSSKLAADPLYSIAHAYILAGGCLALAFRFAGSFNLAARDLLLSYLAYFRAQRSASSADLPLSLATALDSCISVAALAVSVLMAGSGDLPSLRAILPLSSRSDASYGHHMACSMALGFLFLGGGRYTLSNSPPAIAALLCSLYPIFPKAPGEQRYHHQALRHLWVLAATPRCLVARDIFTNEAILLPLSLRSIAPDWQSDFHYPTVAPALVPSGIPGLEVSVESPRYWPRREECEKGGVSGSNGEEEIVLYVQRKTGFLPYAEDPWGDRSILSRSFPKASALGPASQASKLRNRKLQREFLQSFSADPNILAFANHFCSEWSGSSPSLSFFTSVLYECLTHHKHEVLQHYLAIYQLASSLPQLHHSLNLVNFKTLLAFYDHQNTAPQTLIQNPFLHSIRMKLDSILGHNEDLAPYIQSPIHYLHTRRDSSFPNYLIYHDIPSPFHLKQAEPFLAPKGQPSYVQHSIFSHSKSH
jgi:anaphase-promoting complex subunit 1